jgi:hypothetical protein
MYRIPIQEIRWANNLFGHDNLLHARHYVTIPGYHGSSLSGEPVETEEEEIRKVALKRFQLLSKCVDYKMATIYMESSRWDIEMVQNLPPHWGNFRLSRNIRMTWNGRRRIRRKLGNR